MKIKKVGPDILKKRDQKNESNIKMRRVLQKEKFENVPKEIMEVAQGMETQFAHKLFAEMRKTVKKSKPESSAETFYNSMLDYERAKTLTDTTGMGIKEVILDQIYPQYKGKVVPKNAQQIRMIYEQAKAKENNNE